MKGKNTRNAHHNILLLAEIDARRVVEIGMTTNNKCRNPKITRNPINALFMCTSGCSRNARISRERLLACCHVPVTHCFSELAVIVFPLCLRRNSFDGIPMFDKLVAGNTKQVKKG